MKSFILSIVTLSIGSCVSLLMARQTTITPMVIKTEGMTIEIIVLMDLSVVLIFLKKTALVWLAKEKAHSTYGNLKSSECMFY